MRRLLFGGVAIALLLAGCAAPTGGEAGSGGPVAVVETDVGRLRGVVDGDVVRFRGVPFAEPPVGERRWERPVPVAPWAGERDATRSSAPCPQPAIDYPEPQIDEDCLYLEITAPAVPREGRPVLLWLHGGGGYGTASTYDPRRMAVQGDAVVVATNFRFGHVSQLALPGMADPTPKGFADQQEAMRFLQRNIAAFGGDPGNVTLFGESGGGISACAQLTSPAARGLFHKLVVMSPVGLCADPFAPDFSGPGSAQFTGVRAFRPVEQAQADGLAQIAKWGCTDPATALECARQVPAEVMMREPPLPTGGAFAAGTGLPQAPMDAITAGDINPVPVLSGTTRDETQLLLSITQISSGLPPLTADSYAGFVRAAYPQRAEEVLAAYPAADYPSPNDAWIAQSTDRAWSCPAAALNDTLAAHTPVFGYEFADRTAPLLAPVVAPGISPTGAGHSSEVAYLFDLIATASQPPTGQLLDDTQLRLAEEMIGVWTDFARTGDPGTPPWSPERSVVRAFGGDQPEVDLRARHQCDFWAPDIAADLALSRR